jgi:hypothetical protein
MRTVIAACLAVVAVAAATPAYADTQPAVAFTTPTWWPVVGGPVPGVGVEGTVTDDAYAITRVHVSYCGNGSASFWGDPGSGWSCGSGIGGLSGFYEVDATVTCSDAGHRDCTWIANAPLQPDHYLVFAEATDAAGRTGDVPDPIVAVVI